MIITIGGVFNASGGRDLSGYLDRQSSFRVESQMGNQIDTLEMTLFDKYGVLNIPDRAEIIIYDAPTPFDPTLVVFPGVIDSSPPNSTPLGYQWGNFTWDDIAQYDTMPPLSPANNPVTWSGRIFAGYIASTDYYLTSGGERAIDITAQDYTVRNKTTICNKAYGPDAQHPAGWSDGEIIQDLYLTYRPDIDVTFVQTIVPEGQMTPISFPFHTLEQMMQRIIKISGGYYRIDYYKRLWYGPLGTQIAPLQISQTPDPDNGPFSDPPAFGAEAIHYGRDATSSIDRVWVIGGQYLGPLTSYQLSGAAGADGKQFIWDLPAKLQTYRKANTQNPANMFAEVNGIDQGAFGIVGIDGTLDNQATFGENVLVATKAPYVVAFKTTPPAGAVVKITASFTYTLVQVVSNPEAIAKLSGLIIEKVIKDTRISSAQEAVEVGNAHLNLYGKGKAMGKMTVYQRGIGNNLLQPGQLIDISHDALFSWNPPGQAESSLIPGGGITLTAVILSMTTTLIPSTLKYQIEVQFSDQVQLDDDTLFSQLIGEQNRINAAIAQGDVNDLTEDFQFLDEEAAAQDSIIGTPLGSGFVYQ